jgi:hypothetical protein
MTPAEKLADLYAALPRFQPMVMVEQEDEEPVETHYSECGSYKITTDKYSDGSCEYHVSFRAKSGWQIGGWQTITTTMETLSDALDFANSHYLQLHEIPVATAQFLNWLASNN